MSSPLDFGRFQILHDQRELRVEGRAVPIGSRAFDVLMALVERRDRVVSKDELMDLAWPGVVVEENNLQVQVSALRKWLGAQVIVTVPGRGYRFVGTSAAAVGLAPAAPGAARLLVAEDNKVNRLLLVRSLRLLGHDVVAVEDGRQALDHLRRDAFDLLLLDLEMPELDGFTLLEQRAADGALADVPVIVTSSLEGVEQVARCIELGADDYLRKPVNPVLLKARVGSTLERRRLRLQERELIARLRAAADRAGPAAVAPVTAAGAVATACRRAAVVLVARWRAEPPLDAAAPAQMLDLLDSCATLLREAITDRNGRIVVESADALWAVFGYAPQSADDEPVAISASRAALDMAQMANAFNSERRAIDGGAVALGVGLAAGDVLLGPAGLPLAPRFACVGQPVERAAAMAAHAVNTQGAILIDDAVRQALGTRLATAPLPSALAGAGAAFMLIAH